MKDIKGYIAEKYENKSKGKNQYIEVEDGIYETGDGKNKVYVTSLSFVQEPNYGEGESAADISQYPLEDILDKYLCYISDFYEKLNAKESQTCYLEFASDEKKCIKSLRNIIGKHVYNKEIESGDEVVVKLIIE